MPQRYKAKHIKCLKNKKKITNRRIMCKEWKVKKKKRKDKGTEREKIKRGSNKKR